MEGKDKTQTTTNTPVIEVCVRPCDANRAAARLAADHDCWDTGVDVYRAVKNLLLTAESRGYSGKRDDYTVVLLKKQAF